MRRFCGRGSSKMGTDNEMVDGFAACLSDGRKKSLAAMLRFSSRQRLPDHEYRPQPNSPATLVVWPFFSPFSLARSTNRAARRLDDAAAAVRELAVSAGGLVPGRRSERGDRSAVERRPRRAQLAGTVRRAGDQHVERAGGVARNSGGGVRADGGG